MVRLRVSGWLMPLRIRVIFSFLAMVNASFACADALVPNLFQALAA